MAFLLPDPGALRDIADRIVLHAVATRARGGRLRTHLHGTQWQGAAAAAFHAEATAALAGLDSAADRLDSAAAALRRHADNVAGRLHILEQLWHDGKNLAEIGIDIGVGALGDALGAVF